MNVEKWHHSEIRIAINDESQGRIAKNLRCNEEWQMLFNTSKCRDMHFGRSNAHAEYQMNSQ